MCLITWEFPLPGKKHGEMVTIENSQGTAYVCPTRTMLRVAGVQLPIAYPIRIAIELNPSDQKRIPSNMICPHCLNRLHRIGLLTDTGWIAAKVVAFTPGVKPGIIRMTICRDMPSRSQARRMGSEEYF